MDEAIDYQKEIDSLSKMLKGQVDRGELEKELKTYLNKYLMDLESSKRAIVKDHGGSDDDYVPLPIVICNISDIKEGVTCNLVAKVKDYHLIITKAGKHILKINAYDRTGTALIIVWDSEPMVEKGVVYTFRNCHIKYDSFEKRITASCDPDSIAKNDEAKIDSLFKMLKASSISEYDIKDGLSNVVVYGYVKRIWPPSDNPRAPKASGIFCIGDSEFRFVTWEDLPLEEDIMVCIDGVSVSEDKYSDKLQLKFTSGSTVYEDD